SACGGGWSLTVARLPCGEEENGAQPGANGKPGNDGEELGDGHGANACARSARVAFSRSSAGASSASLAIDIASRGSDWRRPSLRTRLIACGGQATDPNASQAAVRRSRPNASRR